MSSSWFDLDLSSIQQQINKSVEDATKALGEVANYDILNLDALAAQEEEDEKYAELLDDLKDVDIESLLARDAPEARHPSLGSAYSNNKVIHEVADDVADEEPDDNEEEETAFDPEPKRVSKSRSSRAVAAAADEWDDFDYPEPDATKSCVTDDGNKDEAKQSLEETATDRNEENPEVLRDTEILTVPDSSSAHGGSHDSGSEHSLSVPRASRIASHLPAESQTDSDADHPPHRRGPPRISELSTSAPVVSESSHSPNKKKKERPAGQPLSSSGVLSIKVKAKEKEKDTRTVTHSSDRLAAVPENQVSSSSTASHHGLPSTIITAQGVEVPIPLDVLERLLKKREKKMRKKALKAGQPMPEPIVLPSGRKEAVIPAIGSLLEDVFGGGYNDCESGLASIVTNTSYDKPLASAEQPTSAEESSHSSWFGPHKDASSSHSDHEESSANKHGEETTSSAASGSIIGGFVFPISFSSLGMETKPSKQYKSVFDDVDEEAANDDPILRQVEANKSMRRNIGQSLSSTGSQLSGLLTAFTSASSALLPSALSSGAAAVPPGVSSTPSGAPPAVPSSSSSSSSPSPSIALSNSFSSWTSSLSTSLPSFLQGSSEPAAPPPSTLSTACQWLWAIIKLLWAIFLFVCKAIWYVLTAFTAFIDNGDRRGCYRTCLSLFSSETYTNPDERARAIESIWECCSSPTGLAVLTGSLLLFSYYKFQRFGTGVGS